MAEHSVVARRLPAGYGVPTARCTSEAGSTTEQGLYSFTAGALIGYTVLVAARLA